MTAGTTTHLMRRTMKGGSIRWEYLNMTLAKLESP